MKTFLAIIGALALLFFAALGGLFFYGVQKVGPMIDQAHAYADESILAVATTWDGAALMARAAPELEELLGNGALDALMAEGNRLLGEMEDYAGAECTITNYQFTSAAGELALAACQATATHKLGSAQYALNIVMRNKEWKVLGFFVTPENTERGPVQVQFVPEQPQGKQYFGVSVSPQISIGVSDAGSIAPFAGIGEWEKIENDL